MGRVATGGYSRSVCAHTKRQRNHPAPRYSARSWIKSNEEAWQSWLRCEELEQRRLLTTALPASVETATLDVLASIRDDFRAAVIGHALLQTQLPIIGASIN